MAKETVEDSRRAAVRGVVQRSRSSTGAAQSGGQGVAGRSAAQGGKASTGAGEQMGQKSEARQERSPGKGMR